jgi:hypothetical protein
MKSCFAEKGCLSLIQRVANVKEVEKMSIERMVLAFAGSFILISLILSQLFSPYWLLFTAFVGANLLQSAFTGFCPLAKILKAMGAKPSGETFKLSDSRFERALSRTSGTLFNKCHFPFLSCRRE